MLANLLLDLLLPPACLACRAPVASQGGLCAVCWGRLNSLSGPGCPCCGHPYVLADHDGMLCGPCLADPPKFNRARAALRYDAGSKGLILSFKHGDRPGLARYVAPWMERAGREFWPDADLLLPVPLHRWRLLKRRYNQAALLAAELARLTGIRHDPMILRRPRATPPQANLNRAARRDNVAGAFALAGGDAMIRGKKIVLIDDVLTTGATLGACAGLLLRAGAGRVDVVTLARVVVPQ